jgi:hypothetical protein
MPALAIAVRARFIIDLPLDSGRGSRRQPYLPTRWRSGHPVTIPVARQDEDPPEQEKGGSGNPHGGLVFK